MIELLNTEFESVSNQAESEMRDWLQIQELQKKVNEIIEVINKLTEKNNE